MGIAIAELNALVQPIDTGLSTLQERAMLTAVHISMWNGQRTDKRVTDEVLKERKAEKDAGRFEKFLVPPKSLEPVRQAATAVRALHYKLTLPWGDEGQRILSATMFEDYTDQLAQAKGVFDAAVRVFLAQYSDLVADAPRRLGVELFKHSDFPSQREIVGKFGISHRLWPVPDQADFRVSLGEETEQKIRRSIEQSVTAQAAEAQRDLWERLLETLKHFASKMMDKEAIFRDSTITKLTELAQLAPKLSLVPNPRLDEICAQIVKITSVATPQAFRDNDLLRAQSARKANDALAQISEAMQGAF